MAIKSEICFFSFHLPQQEQTSNTGREYHRGFKHGIVSPIVGEDSGDDIGYGGVLHGLFNVVWRHMGAGWR